MKGLRRPRWASVLRPKRVAAPRAPSLTSFIRNADDWGLQQRICRTPAVMMEIAEHGDFWEKQWPGLLREACKTKSQNCLRLLLNVRREGFKDPPGLPPQFVGWLVHGLIERSESYSGLDKNTQDLIYSRLRTSKVSLRKEDGLAILGMGGPDGAFYHFQRDTQGSVDSLPAVVEAWRKWCSKQEHQHLGVELITRGMREGGLRRGERQSFRVLVESSPVGRREALVEAMLQGLDNTGMVRSASPNQHQQIGAWFHLFHEQGWNTHAPLWEAWVKRLCRGVADDSVPGTNAFATTWARIFLENPTIATVPGWTWNVGMARGFFLGRTDAILPLLEKHEAGSWIGDQIMAQAATWLRETHEVWDRLVATGLVNEQDREDWRRQQGLAMGQDWEARMDRLVMARFDEKDAAPLVMRWTKWKARELAASVGHDHEAEPAHRPLRM